MHPVIHGIEHYDLLAQQWATRSRATGRSTDPRARQLRARATALATHLAELRKRLAEARELAQRIDALVTEETAEDAVEETEAARLAA